MKRTNIRKRQKEELGELSRELTACEDRGDKDGLVTAALALRAFIEYAVSPRHRDAAAHLCAPHDEAIKARVAVVVLREHDAR